MSYAEMFLMTWAGIATLIAVLASNKVKAMQRHVGAVSALLAELAYGDVKPKIRDDGFYVVENEEIRMSFKKKENGDGVSE
jgi:hypothetical protein